MTRLEDEHVLIGLIGDGIGKSLSPTMHHREAVRQGLRYIYTIIDTERADIANDNLGEAIEWCKRLGFRGLNITHPFKQEVIDHLDELSDAARGVNAVNTVVFEGGKSVGYNTDYSGFRRGFERGMNDAARDRVLQLGAGGAGSAVARAMLELGTGLLSILDSDAGKAARLRNVLADEFGPERVVTVNPEDKLEVLANSQGLVNTTPIGMDHMPGSPVPESALRADLWVADVVYRPTNTELLQAASRVGARTLNGGGMNAFQAIAAIELFTGNAPDVEAMLKDSAELLQAEN